MVNATVSIWLISSGSVWFYLNLPNHHTSYYHRWTLTAAGYSTQLQVSQGEKYRIAFPPSFHPPTCTSVPFMSSPPDEHHVFVFTCPFFLFPHKQQLVFPTLNYIQNQIIKHYYFFVSKKKTLLHFL